MRYICTFMLLVICLITKAQGIYFLKNDDGLKPLKRGSQLNLQIKDHKTMSYQLTDSLGSYIIYADLELYDKVGNEIVIVQKGFDIKFPTTDSIKEFLKNEGIVLKELSMFIYLNDHLINTNTVTISGILSLANGEYSFSVYEHSDFPIIIIHGINYNTVKEKRDKLVITLNNCEAHISRSGYLSSIPKITVKY